jgi:rhodanese-related sulfurtransferase
MSVDAVTPEELRELLGSDKDVRLIDVRRTPEFREVHVVGARSVPYGRLSTEQLLTDGDETSPYYFICTAGKRSEKACEKARKLGLANVVSVEGGTNGCVAAGLPVERGRKAFSLERQVRIAAGAMVFIGAVLALTVHPYWAALPAFVGAGLVYAGITNSCGMALVLAELPWNR